MNEGMTKTEKERCSGKGGKNTINILTYYDAAILVTFSTDKQSHFHHLGRRDKIICTVQHM